MTALPSLSDNQQVDHQITEIAAPAVLFQAVGVIVGSVDLSDDDNMSVKLGQSKYQLLYAPGKQRALDALKKEVAATGKALQRLVVYPKIIHFPKREQPHAISFQLVGFDRGQKAENAASSQLEDLEFKLAGLWQFIPVCPTPCISVFRNFTPERLEYIKQAELARKVKFMKASHVPVLWKDAPVRPFRFNPKADYDQGHPVFISLKAKFLPHRNVFGFVALLAPPLSKAPKFLKASKEDKTLVQQEAKQHQSQSPSTQTLTGVSPDTNQAVSGNQEKSGNPAPAKTLKEKPRLKKNS